MMTPEPGRCHRRASLTTSRRLASAKCTRGGLPGRETPAQSAEQPKEERDRVRETCFKKSTMKRGTPAARRKTDRGTRRGNLTVRLLHELGTGHLLKMTRSLTPEPRTERKVT